MKRYHKVRTSSLTARRLADLDPNPFIPSRGLRRALSLLHVWKRKASRVIGREKRSFQRRPSPDERSKRVFGKLSSRLTRRRVVARAYCQSEV